MSLPVQIASLALLAAAALGLLVWISRWPRRPYVEIVRACLLALPLSVVAAFTVWAALLPGQTDAPDWTLPTRSLAKSLSIWALAYVPCLLLVLWLRQLGQPGPSRTLPAPGPARPLPPPDEAQAPAKDLSTRVAQLTPPAYAALDYAARLSVEAGNLLVTPPHLLVACIETDKPTRDLLHEAGIDPFRVSQQAKQWLAQLSGGCEGRPAFAPELVQLLEEATRAADEPVSTRQLISALLTVPTLREHAMEVAEDLARIGEPGESPVVERSARPKQRQEGSRAP